MTELALSRAIPSEDDPGITRSRSGRVCVRRALPRDAPNIGCVSVDRPTNAEERRASPTAVAGGVAAALLVSVCGGISGLYIAALATSGDVIRIRENPPLFVGILVAIIACCVAIATLVAAKASRALARRYATRRAWLAILTAAFLLAAGAAAVWLLYQAFLLRVQAA